MSDLEPESAVEIVARLQGAIDRLVADAALDREAARPTLLELSTALEELRAADEELAVQTEQLAASAELIDAERARYAELFDLAPDPFVETDRNGKVLEANRAAEQLLGLPVRLLIGKLLVSFVAPDERRAFRNLLAGAADAQHETIFTLRPREGAEVSVGVALSSHLAQGAERLHVRWILRDVTERLRLEAQVSGLEAENELLVALHGLASFTDAEDPLDRSMENILDLAASLVPGAEVGTTLRSGHREHRVLARTDRAARLDHLQREVGDGPCIEALRSAVVVRGAPERWPAIVGEATEGLVELLGVPIAADGEAVGVINVYARRTVPDAALRQLELLAQQAGAAVRTASLLVASSEVVHQLQHALDSRRVIEQAKGILVARGARSLDEAFEVLRRAARRERSKIQDVATRLVQSTAVDS